MKKRLLLYVLWERNGDVRDFVAYSLEQYRAFAGDVLVIANGGLSVQGRERLEAIGVRYIERENTGLDFAAWKTAIEQEGWEKLTALDELILANCSCYGPIYPLPEVFERMEPAACDFWGITRYPEIADNVIPADPATRTISHLQSYFLVFRQAAIRSACFRRWWETLVPAASYGEEVGYHEVPFTRYLEQGGLRAAAYYPDARSVVPNPTVFADAEQVRERRIPFIKVKMFDEFLTRYERAGMPDFPHRMMALMEAHTAYPMELVWSNIAGVKGTRGMLPPCPLPVLTNGSGTQNTAAVVQLSFCGERMKLLLDAPAAQAVTARSGGNIYEPLPADAEDEWAYARAVWRKQGRYLLTFDLPLAVNRWVEFRQAAVPLPLHMAAPWNMAQRYILLRCNRLKVMRRTDYMRALSLSPAAPALWSLRCRMALARRKTVLFVETGHPNKALRTLCLLAAKCSRRVSFMPMQAAAESLPPQLRALTIPYSPAVLTRKVYEASCVVSDGVLPPCTAQECLYPMLRARVVLAYPQTADLLRGGHLLQLLYQKPVAVLAASPAESCLYGSFLGCSYRAHAPEDSAERLLTYLQDVIYPAAAETLRRLSALGLPDTAYYPRRYPEVALAQQSPLRHYAAQGWLAGYDPCAAAFFGKNAIRLNRFVRSALPLCQIAENLLPEEGKYVLPLTSCYAGVPAAAPSVLLVSHLLDYSGAPLALLALVEPLQRMGLAVIVLSPVDGPLQQAFEQKGCRVLVAPRPQDIDPLCFRMVGAELCICNTVVMSACFRAYSAVLPTLLWIHENMCPPAAEREFLYTENESLWGWESATYGVMNPRLLQTLQPLQKRVAFCSDWARAPFRELLPDSFVLPYIARDQSAAEEAELPSPRGGAFVHFAFIGSYNQRKSPHLIIEALALMPPQLRRRCRITLVGQPAVRDAYALNLETRAAPFAEVQLLPVMEPQDVQRFLKTVDVLLCPSQTDPMPLVVTEAWMHGCAVVMSEAVGQRCLAEEGESRNAYVVPVGDAAALAAVMQHLAEHTEELPRLSQNARRTYCRRFDAETAARRWMEQAEQLRGTAGEMPALPAVSAAEVQAAMPAAPLLVHLNGQRGICRLLPYLIALAPYPYDLVVTLSPDCAVERAKIAAFCPQAVFVELPEEEAAYAHPLIHLLQQVDVSRYSFYLSLDAADRRAEKDSAALLQPRRLTDTLAAFRRCSALGMVGNSTDVYLYEPAGKSMEQSVTAVLAEQGYAVREYAFVARNVFACRCSLLPAVARLQMPAESTHNPAQLFNRCWGCMVGALGYEVSDAYTTGEARRAAFGAARKR